MLLEAESNQLRSAVEGVLGEALSALQLFSQCDSTNRLCLQQARHKNIVIAKQQTAGRGRRGRQWLSPEGQNIYCSIGLDKTLAAQYLGLISLRVGISIAAVLHRHGFTEVGLKWPNDIVVGQQKLGGILIESRPQSSNEFYLVIGFGLNVALDDATLAAIDRPAISLQQLSQTLPDHHRLLVDLIAAIVRDVTEFGAAHVDDLLEQFATFDQFHDREVEVKTRSGSIFGQYRGIHASGQLQVETAEGLQLFSAADISLRTAAGECECC